MTSDCTHQISSFPQFRPDLRESEWTLGVGDGQGGLEYCDSWGHKESDMTEQLNWTELNWPVSALGKWNTGRLLVSSLLLYPASVSSFSEDSLQLSDAWNSFLNF